MNPAQFPGMGQPMPFGFPLRAPQNPIPMAPALYVGDLDENIREEALYDLFSKFGQLFYIRLMRDPQTSRSRGFAYVNFCNPRDAEQAKLVAQHEKLGRKCIRIMYKRTIKGLDEGNVFVKNIDKNVTVKELHTFFSTVGTVISAKVATNQNGDSLGYGYVQFEKPEDAHSAIEKTNGAKLKETNIEVVKFVSSSSRGPRKRNNLYIKHLPDSDEKELEAKLRKEFSQYGEVDQMLVKKDPKIQKCFSFVCFRESEAAQKAVDDYKNNPRNPFDESVPLYVNFSQTKQERENELRKRRAEANNRNNLFVKNLAPEATKQALTDLFSQFGEVVSCDIKKWESGNNTRNVQYGFVAFKTQEEAQKAINRAHEVDAIKKLFVEERPIINIFQNKEQRSKFLQTQQRRYGGGAGGMPGMFPFGGPSRDMQNQMQVPGRGKFPPLFQYPMPMGMPGGNGPQNFQNRGPRPMNKGPGHQGPRPPFQQGGQRPPYQDRRGGPHQGGPAGQRQNVQRDQGQFPRQNFGGQGQDRRPPQTQPQAQKAPVEKTAAAGGQPSASTITVADLKKKMD